MAVLLPLAVTAAVAGDPGGDAVTPRRTDPWQVVFALFLLVVAFGVAVAKIVGMGQ